VAYESQDIVPYGVKDPHPLVYDLLFGLLEMLGRRSDIETMEKTTDRSSQRPK
jgi:hypothetical protein